MFSSPFLLPAVAIVFIIAMVALVMIRQGLAARGAMVEAADELGLTWTATGALAPGEITGAYRDQPVRVFLRQEGVGSFARLMTVVEIEFDPAIPMAFELSHESVFTRIRRALGRPDIEFNDPEFDALYRVDSPHPDSVRTLFSAPTRAALVTMAKGSSDFDVNPTRILWKARKRIYNGKTLVRVVKAGVAAAASMRAATPRGAARPHPNLFT